MMEAAPTSPTPACSQDQGSCDHTESAYCVVEEERNDAPERRPSPSQGSSGGSEGVQVKWLSSRGPGQVRRTARHINGRHAGHRRLFHSARHPDPKSLSLGSPAIASRVIFGSWTRGSDARRSHLRPTESSKL